MIFDEVFSIWATYEEKEGGNKIGKRAKTRKGHKT